jgi:hypothetical protein
MRRPPATPDAFPEPAGSAGAAHFAGAASLERARRTEALRARAEGRPERAPAAPSGRPARIADPPGDWPRPPACLTAAELALPPDRARVAVCGLVIVRQRPGSAKGVLFVTLEDETGVVNVVVWAKVYEAHRRAVLAARLLRVTGRVQRDGPVVHVVAEIIEDVSRLLDLLTAAPRPFDTGLARADEVARPNERGSRPEARGAGERARGLIKGAAPRAMHPREQAKLLFRRPPDATD